jgi:hypothetical protein
MFPTSVSPPKKNARNQEPRSPRSPAVANKKKCMVPKPEIFAKNQEKKFHLQLRIEPALGELPFFLKDG